MRTLRYIVLLLILTQCETIYPYRRQNPEEYFLLIDSLENNRPSWLTDHLFIYINNPKLDSTPDSNYLWIDYYAFFNDNTFEHGSYVKYKGSYTTSNTLKEMPNILINIRDLQFKSRAFFRTIDSLYQSASMGGIYVVQNDTIKIKPYAGKYYSTLLYIDYRMRSSVFAIDQKERSLEQVKFGIYPKTVAQNIAWGQNPERRKYKGYPVTFLDSLPPLPLSQWPPFRRWKARLDSINAGLRPPEKSR